MSDELSRARLYLTLGEDEMANVRAEHAKYERRKAAMAYADANSHLPDAITFAPILCSGCDCHITYLNRSYVYGKCQKCLGVSVALREAKPVAPKPKPRSSSWSVFWFVVAACAVALALPWAIDQISWWIGMEVMP